MVLRKKKGGVGEEGHRDKRELVRKGGKKGDVAGVGTFVVVSTMPPRGISPQGNS